MGKSIGVDTSSPWHAPTAVNRQQRGSILRSGPISDEMHVKLVNETRRAARVYPQFPWSHLETAVSSG